MSSSGNKINYMLRLAKGIERKLIKDSVLRIIQQFGTSKYKYIGFGSKYFADFIYFHRHLHIENMVSIEIDEENYQKYEFNKPFACIDLHFGNSNDIVPKLDYCEPILSWLDYDGIFDKAMIADMVTQIEKCASGSIIILSYNSKPYQNNNLKQEFNLDNDASTIGLIRKKLEKQVGKELIPIGFQEQGLKKWVNFSGLLRQIVTNQIQTTLTSINTGVEDKLLYKQLYYFDYKDGVEMSTLGGIFYKESDSEKLRNSGVEEFDFIRESEERCLIEAPMLTGKEIRELLSSMPIKNEAQLDTITEGNVFEEDAVIQFSKYYKYYPQYSEVDL